MKTEIYSLSRPQPQHTSNLSSFPQSRVIIYFLTLSTIHYLDREWLCAPYAWPCYLSSTIHQCIATAIYAFILSSIVLISLSPHSLTIGLLVFTFSLSCLVYHTLSITGSDYVPHSMALLSTITYPSVYCHCHLFTFLILFKLIISPIISPAFVAVTSTNYTILFVL